MANERTNTTLDGEITGQNPDAGADFYLIADHNRDVDYITAQIRDYFKFISNDTTDEFQILYGGIISDGGSGTINISAGAAFGKDANGKIRIIEIPGLTGVSLPSGWNDNRKIWVVGQHQYITTGTTRTHDETAESYHYTMVDSYLGSVTSDNLFEQADPSGTKVIWGAFRMNGTTYSAESDRSIQFVIKKSLLPGVISGGLEFNTTITPPIVKSGFREVNGNLVIETTDVSLATADALGGVSQTFADHAYTWQRLVADISNNYYYVPSFDTASPVLTDISVSGIVIAAGTATVSTSNTTGLAVGHMAVIKGATISGQPLILIGKVVSISAGVNFTVKTSASGTVAGTITYSAYGRIVTLHGTGAATVVNTDTDVTKYTPSPDFCAELNGYYLDQYGIPTTSAASAVYRILGVWELNGSGQTNKVYSYKSGKDKNDNYLLIDGATGYGSTNTRILRYTNIQFSHGSDYIYAKSTTLGDSITTNSGGDIGITAVFHNSVSSDYIGLSVDSTQLSTNVSTISPIQPYIYAPVLTSINTTIHRDLKLKKGQVIRAHVTNASGFANGFIEMTMNNIK